MVVCPSISETILGLTFLQESDTRVAEVVEAYRNL